jgi:hypothetical protein
MPFRRNCVGNHCDLLPTNITLDRLREVTVDLGDGWGIALKGSETKSPLRGDIGAHVSQRSREIDLTHQ